MMGGGWVSPARGRLLSPPCSQTDPPSARLFAPPPPPPPPPAHTVFTFPSAAPLAGIAFLAAGALTAAALARGERGERGDLGSVAAAAGERQRRSRACALFPACWLYRAPPAPTIAMAWRLQAWRLWGP